MLSAMSPTWQLERLTKLSRQQPQLVERAVQRLLGEDAELLWALAVSSYLDGEISLAKAAELLDMHALELRERFAKLGIPVRLGPADVEEARAEVAAARGGIAPSSTE